MRNVDMHPFGTSKSDIPVPTAPEVPYSCPPPYNSHEMEIGRWDNNLNYMAGKA